MCQKRAKADMCLMMKGKFYVRILQDDFQRLSLSVEKFALGQLVGVEADHLRIRIGWLNCAHP